MPVQRYFLLDSTATGYAAAIADVAAKTSTNRGYTVTQVVRTVPSTNFRIICAYVDEADLTGDSANLHSSNVPNALCRGRFNTLNQFRTFGFHVLGESVRSSEGIASRAIIFLAQTSTGAADGSTPHDAISIADYRDNVSTTWATGTTFVFLGFQIGTWGPSGAGTAEPAVNDPDFQDATSAPIRWRMDYADDPGMLHIGFIDARSNNNAFTRPDPVNHPRVWTATWDIGGPSAALWLTPVDPTLSTTALYTNHVFATAASQAEVEATPLSRWVNGLTLWVHMPDDSDPTDRIANATPSSGYNPATSYMTTGTRFGGLEFVNCQMIGGSVSTGSSMAGNTGKLPAAKFLGGRYLCGVSWKPSNPTTDNCEWGRSTDGDIPWDTSDRPDPDTDPYIQNQINEHGSDAAIWATIKRFLEIDSSEEGVYCVHSGVTNNPDNGVAFGTLIRNIGTRHSALQTKFGADGFDDVDAHCIGVQGGSGWTAKFNYCENFGLAINFYCIDDATSSQNCQNNIIEDNVVHTSNSKHAVSLAGMGGITIGDDGTGPRTDGSGVKTGCIIRRNYVGNIVGDPAAIINGAVTDGKGINIAIEQGHIITENTVESCTNNFYDDNNELTDDTYVDHPAYLDTQVTLTLNRSLTPLQYHVWHRPLNWTSASPANLGYIRSNNNLWRHPSGSTVAAAELFRFVSTTLTFAQWQAQSKAAPPGELASIFDPDSTCEEASA